MAIKFIIDSASDILPSYAKEHGIIHVPLKVRFGDQEYLDAVELTHKDFYEKLIESDVVPTTSQIPPAEFSDAYEKATANGDYAVVITISSKLSGTYQSAKIAAEEYEGKVFVVDSENVTIGERILLLRGMELNEQGYSAEEIASILDEEKKKIRLIALLDTLEYLKKGGRVSKTTAFVGGMLSIKPVIAVENGEVAVIEKARGSKQGNNFLRELVVKCGGINFEKPYCLAYSGLSDELLQKYIADSEELWNEKVEKDKIPISVVGCAIGTHAGPGAVALAFFEK